MGLKARFGDKGIRAIEFWWKLAPETGINRG